MREVRSSDFGDRARIRMYFPRKGSQFTPPHNSIDFSWKDYCPMVFRYLPWYSEIYARETVYVSILFSTFHHFMFSFLDSVQKLTHLLDSDKLFLFELSAFKLSVVYFCFHVRDGPPNHMYDCYLAFHGLDF